MTAPVVKLPDGTVWPNPERASELDWLCRYGDPRAVQDNRMAIASIISAYRYLVETPAAAKKLPAIRRAVRKGAES